MKRPRPRRRSPRLPPRRRPRSWLGYCSGALRPRPGSSTQYVPGSTVLSGARRSWRARFGPAAGGSLRNADLGARAPVSLQSAWGWRGRRASPSRPPSERRSRRGGASSRRTGPTSGRPCRARSTSGRCTFAGRTGLLLAFAALWERRCVRGSKPVETCAILTTEANVVVRPVHDRIPVILTPGDFAAWLDPRMAGELRHGPAPRPRGKIAVVTRRNRDGHKGLRQGD